MRVKLLDREWEMANDPSSIGELFTIIEEKLKGTGYIFSSLTVDGVELETDFALYLSQRIGEIREILVGVKSFRRLMQETMESAAQYLERAQPEVEKLSTEFYQGPTEESWDKFSQLLEGLQWLLEVVTTVESYQPEKQNAPGRSGEFNDKIKQLQEALQNSDHVLLGDLLQYEIAPLFFSLKQEIQEYLMRENIDPAKLN
ncbi:MAG TPA: hypothetical protein VIL83_06850 [Capillibacterium sp.]